MIYFQQGLSVCVDPRVAETVGLGPGSGRAPTKIFFFNDTREVKKGGI